MTEGKDMEWGREGEWGERREREKRGGKGQEDGGEEKEGEGMLLLIGRRRRMCRKPLLVPPYGEHFPTCGILLPMAPIQLNPDS